MAATSFITQIAAFIATRNLIRPGDLIVAAVSGGPDSLAMLHALVALRGEFGYRLHVVHLDHMLRGTESANEALFVETIAQQWGLPATVEAHDVAQLAQTNRLNLYAAGRAARYQLFARIASSVGAQAVAVAHTANDQAETLLMHLLRGAGSEGLAGMQPLVAWKHWRSFGAGFGTDNQTEVHAQAPSLIRPMLTITRAAIETYCREQGLPARRDPANDDTRHTRSRIRHDLLPQLIEYNPRIIEALCRTADTLAIEHDLIDQALDAYWPQLANQRSAGIDLNLAIWQTLHPALQRTALRRAYAYVGGRATFGLADIERVMTGIASGVGRVIELPGGMPLTVGYRTLTFGVILVEGPQLVHDAEPLPLSGEIMLKSGWRLIAAIEEHALSNTSSWVVQIAQELIAGALVVRRRRPGDRINGRRGSRSIQDVMVDAKLPQALRAAWPMLVVGEQIMWVAGVRVADGVQAESGAPAVRIEIIQPERVSAEE